MTVLEKCHVCQALLDEEDLFCANCGKSAQHASPRQAVGRSRTSTHNFECHGCGASMSYDATVGNLRCPFCGSEKLEKQADQKVLAPERIVPFCIDRSAAETTLRQWLGRGFWKPGDLATTAKIAQIAPVFVPYWVFHAKTHSYWTADSRSTPFGSKSGWYPVSGENHSQYQGLLVGASGALTPNETEAICPFDLAASVAPDEVDLNPITVEQFTVPRKFARPLARQGLERSEYQACADRYLQSGFRNLKVNVLIKERSSQPVLLPVWIMAYRYRDSIYRFLINGQTGKTTGEAPLSYLKAAIVTILVAILILILVLFAVIANQ